MTKITVIKQNSVGDETWRYSGRLLAQTADYLVLEAYFDREDMDFFGMRLCRGDRFVETYFFARYFNIFEIYDAADAHFKGYYCNVASPAVMENAVVSYRDWALDLLIFPDGRQVILDEDEFAALQLSSAECTKALAALADLQALFVQIVENGKLSPAEFLDQRLDKLEE